MKKINALKHRVTSILTGTALVAASSQVVYALDLPEFSATYAVSADGKKGTATRTLRKSNQGYKYTVSGSAARIATLQQEAHFGLVNGKVQPRTAKMSAKILGIGNTHDIRFNYGSKTVVSTYKGQSTTLHMGRQAYDDLSMEVQIRQELMNGKFSGSYPLVKRRDIEITKFKKMGNTQITVPAGTYSVIRIDRIHTDKNRATSFWLAPSLNYLPIKVSQTADGKVISMELTKLN